jgi:hypothetical protein
LSTLAASLGLVLVAGCGSGSGAKTHDVGGALTAVDTTAGWSKGDGCSDRTLADRPVMKGAVVTLLDESGAKIAATTLQAGVAQSDIECRLSFDFGRITPAAGESMVEIAGQTLTYSAAQLASKGYRFELRVDGIYGS